MKIDGKGRIKMKYRNDRKGSPISILGYGCMRFTKSGNKLDFDKAEKELLEAYNNGVNYFDTAYIYSGSEALIGEIFERLTSQRNFRSIWSEARHLRTAILTKN